jgi:hypothetical protein
VLSLNSSSFICFIISLFQILQNLIISVENMKKKEKLVIGLFSALIVLSFVNTSTAAPPSYIGVATGDVYTWVPSINMASVNATGIALFGQDNWTIAYSMLSELYKNGTGMDLGVFVGAGLRVTLTNVSDQITVAPGIYVSALTMDIEYSAGLNNWTMLVNNTMTGIYDPNSLNETTIVAAFGGIPFIMAKGFNYTMATNALNTIIAANPYTVGNMTVQTQGNGYKITLLASYLQAAFNSTGAPFNLGSLGNAVFNVRWNLNGVLEYGDLVYGGLTFASIQLVANDDSIPGFEIVTIIGVSIVTIIAIIYIKRKKNL